MKTHKNISIFIPHAGCPHQCSFCNQKVITAQEKLPHAEDVQRICRKALSEMPDISNTEIAFFGGSFTAIPRTYMIELLESAQEFIGEDKFSGIRISTRPDYINKEILEILKSYHVTAIELGAQSISDKVLEANHRGHTAEDVYHASELIRKYGFELGLQLMVGLYQSTWKDEYASAQWALYSGADTLRIYPVVILKNTELAEKYQSGEYSLIPFEEIVMFVSTLMEECALARIKVIKCGLHASEFVQSEMIGGYYHPAFRELCEGEIYRRKMSNLYFSMPGRLQKGKTWTFFVRPDCISKAIGHKQANREYFREQHGIDIRIIGDENLALYQVKTEGLPCI